MSEKVHQMQKGFSSRAEEGVDPLLADLPMSAAWDHSSRVGIETTNLFQTAQGARIYGATTALEDGAAWNVAYEIALDAEGLTRRATIHTRFGEASRTTLLEHDGRGSWEVDGERARDLHGCLDVDLEASALTNAFPLRRVRDFAQLGELSVPAAYVRVAGTSVERLEQTYQRLDRSAGSVFRMRYEAPSFSFRCVIAYDEAGLVTDYPGIATRLR